MKVMLSIVVALLITSTMTLQVSAQKTNESLNAANSDEDSKSICLTIQVVPDNSGTGFEFPQNSPSYVEYTDRNGNNKKEPISAKSLKLGEEYMQEVNGVKVTLSPEIDQTSTKCELRIAFQRPGGKRFVYWLRKMPTSLPLSPGAPLAETVPLHKAYQEQD